MEASKVTLTPITRQLSDMPMDEKQRAKLKESRLFEYIRSKPAGTRITYKELKPVIGANNEGTVASFLTARLRQRKIQRHPVGIKGYSFSVSSDARVITPPPARPERSRRQRRSKLSLASLKDFQALAKPQSRNLQCALAGRILNSTMTCAAL